MITQIQGMADDVAAFRVTGHVTKEDYDTVVLPVVKQITQNTGHINFVLVLNTDLKNYTMGAWWDDAWLTLKNLTKFNRVALVSDSETVKKVTELGAKLIPGEYKTFPIHDEQIALNWVNAAHAVT